MKMKKMMAILAALSVLGTTGLTVGAEDTATTTEPATEAITTNFRFYPCNILHILI